MNNCACGNGHHASGSGPYAEGKSLVEFVARAHGGRMRNAPISGGGLTTTCQGCGAPFTLATYVGACPACGGVHAVAPPRSNNAANIQFAGIGYQLP